MTVVKKEEIEARVEEGSVALIEAEIAFRRGFMSMETGNYEDAVGAVERSRERLEEAITIYGNLIELAKPGVNDDVVSSGNEEPSVGGSPFPAGERLVDDVERHGELEGLFLEDPELWEFLTTKYLLDDPMACYGRFTWMMREVRNSLDGYLTYVEDGADSEVLQDAAWKTSALFMRTMNFGHMIAFLNRETDTA